MKHISIEIIQKCPNRCLHCSSLSSLSSIHKIETNKVKEVIDGAKALNTQEISLSGGEPFEHDGLLDIVKYIKRYDIQASIYTSGIVTKNGVANSLDISTLRELRNIQVDKLIFSLLALDEKLYDKIVGVDGYQKFVIDSIRKSKELGIFTELHFVPNKLNLQEIDKVLEFAEYYKIDKVSFIRLVLHGRALENKNILALDKLDEQVLKERLNSLSSNKIRVGIPLQLNDNECCYASKDKLCIRYDGSVFGCETFKYINLYDENGKIVYPDSIYNRRLDEIYLDSRYLRLAKKFIEEQLRNHICNEKCPIQRKIKDV